MQMKHSILVFFYILSEPFCAFCQQCGIRKVGYIWRAVLPTGEGMGMILLCALSARLGWHATIALHSVVELRRERRRVSAVNPVKLCMVAT
jgi:hypothetical protein